MPVMSGHEATGAIKADPELADIPVIALTASAMKQDRERARAVGCEGFAAKPVQLPELFAEMTRVLKAAGITQETPLDKPEAPEAEESEALMQELRSEYMTELAATLAELDTLAAKGDAAGLAAIGHRLKGNGAACGFPEITELGAQIEQLGQAADIQAILPHLAELRRIHADYQHAAG